MIFAFVLRKIFRLRNPSCILTSIQKQRKLHYCLLWLTFRISYAHFDLLSLSHQLKTHARIIFPKIFYVTWVSDLMHIYCLLFLIMIRFQKILCSLIIVSNCRFRNIACRYYYIDSGSRSPVVNCIMLFRQCTIFDCSIFPVRNCFWNAVLRNRFTNANICSVSDNPHNLNTFSCVMLKNYITPEWRHRRSVCRKAPRYDIRPPFSKPITTRF